MRALRKNKQKMNYALFKESVPVYEKDEQGNPIVDFVDEQGNTFYRETGSNKDVYYAPVEFFASISSNLNEMRATEYGVDPSSIFSEIIADKGTLPLTFGAKIWRTSEIQYDSDNDPIPESADYTVKGVLDEFLNYDFFLLERITKE